MHWEIGAGPTPLLFIDQNGDMLFNTVACTIPIKGQIIRHENQKYEVVLIEWQTQKLDDPRPIARLLIATIQLQAVADGCLNKEGE